MNSDGLFASLTALPVLGVAIGLVFTYLVASLVASAVKEAVAAVFQWRGSYVQQGIAVMLSHSRGTAFAWGSVRAWFSAHVTRIDPTVAPLSALETAGKACEQALDLVRTAVASPQDIAKAECARTAGQAASGAVEQARGAIAASGWQPDVLVDVGAKAAGDIEKAARSSGAEAGAALADAEKAVRTFSAAVAVSSVQVHPLLKCTPTRMPSYVAPQDFASALLDALRDGSGGPLFAQASTTVKALPDGDIKRILSAFLQDAGGDIDKLRARIETWFDDSMDRLSGIYKRFTQAFLLALGLLIAVGLNIDSVHLVAALWNQPTLRTQIVAQAQADLPTSGDTAPHSRDTPTADAAAIRQAVARVQMLPQPIGWGPCSGFMLPPATAHDLTNAASSPADRGACPARESVHWLRWDILAVVGWLITAFAISLGAPFWFDLLQSFMRVRAAGAPPHRADVTAPSQQR